MANAIGERYHRHRRAVSHSRGYGIAYDLPRHQRPHPVVHKHYGVVGRSRKCGKSINHGVKARLAAGHHGHIGRAVATGFA